MRVLAGIVAVLKLGLTAEATTWIVEKDGSGDFTIIQDAIDAAAPGDSILVGPGRFDDFRPGESVVDGFEFQSIAWISTTDLALLGSGAGQTVIGPENMLVRGSHILNGGSLSVDPPGATTRTVDLVGNRWGTSDPTTISAWISDLNGNVIHEPSLPGPVPTGVKSVSSMKALFDELNESSRD